MLRILQHRATATFVALAALAVALVALLLPRGDSTPGSGEPEAPSVAVPRQPAETISYVQRALDFYDAEGREATIAHYNAPESVDGEYYLFILDAGGELLAHINQTVVGGSVHADLGIDADGYRYGLVMLEATPEGMWIDYVYLNPNTGFRELKHSWVVRHDDLIFGSGWYELQRPSVVEFV